MSKLIFGMTLTVVITATLFALYGVALATTADGCVRYATQADVENLFWSGEDFKIGGCLRNADIALLQPPQSRAAKEFLYSIRCSDSAGGTTAIESVRHLDTNFAICAANFLNAAKSSAVPDVCLREGYRTPEQQAKPSSGVKCKPTNTATGYPCEHPIGVAIDVNTSMGAEGYKILENNAPNFGLVFYVAGIDPYHFVPTALRVEKGKINRYVQVAIEKGEKNGIPSGACLTAGYTPNIADIGTQKTIMPAITNWLREALGVTQQQGGQGQQSLESTFANAIQQALKSGTSGGGSSGSGGSGGNTQPTSPAGHSGGSTSGFNDTYGEGEGSDDSDGTHGVSIRTGSETEGGDDRGHDENSSEGATSMPEDYLAHIASLGSDQDENDTEERGYKFTVPLLEVEEVARLINEGENFEVHDIVYVSDTEAIVEVRGKHDDFSVSGFQTGGNEVFTTKRQENFVRRWCTNHPWHGTSISSFMISPVFDRICTKFGVEPPEEFGFYE